MTEPFCIPAGRVLVLASSSPRRQHLLSTIVRNFTVRVPQVEEPTPSPLIPPKHFARMASTHKARSISAAPNEIILAADTVVAAGREIFGKPIDSADAFRMLKALNGKTHQVYTAFTIAAGKNEYCESICTSVHFGKWPDETLRAYAYSEEPLDKAGAYAIQGNGAFLVERIRGSWTNVVGLPLSELIKALVKFNYLIPA